MSKTRVSDTPRGSRNAAVSVAVTATLSGFVTHPEETYPLGNPLSAETMALDDSLGHVSKTQKLEFLTHQEFPVTPQVSVAVTLICSGYDTPRARNLPEFDLDLAA